VTVPQKILCSFLLSALLVAGIVALAFAGIFADYGGIAGESTRILMPLAIFLTLFLIIFFCFNLRRDSVEEPEALETVEETSADFMSADAVQVESVTGLGGSFFMFRQPFAFTPGNPELLQGAGNADIVSVDAMSEVVYEEDGIHYINSNVFADDERKEEFDNNFAKLVESVVNKIDT
jgi:hypothetical protein